MFVIKYAIFDFYNALSNLKYITQHKKKICILGGALIVTVIHKKMESVIRFQTMNETVFVLLCVNALEKGMTHFFLFKAMG